MPVIDDGGANAGLASSAFAFRNDTIDSIHGGCKRLRTPCGVPNLALLPRANPCHLHRGTEVELCQYDLPRRSSGQRIGMNPASDGRRSPAH
jgi:hypothetical protein